jgi:acetoin utilization deacetylase AcuC-like enzyme
MLVSAGFDAHRDDPLANCELTEVGFAAMTRSLCAVADSMGAPLGCVLEGGYALDALGRSVAATMAALVEAPASASG